MVGLPASNKLFGVISIYALCIVIGMVLAIFFATKEEKRLKLPKDTIVDAALLVIPFGIIGARLFYVLFSWDAFKSQPWKILYVWEGGLAIYGGILVGMLALYLFTQKRKLSFLLLLDVVVPGVALAQSIGRWGNYFNMEAYGYPIQNAALHFFPFGVPIIENGVLTWHYATFFYESCLTLILFFILRFLQKRKIFDGEVFVWYLVLYGGGRTIIEGLRTDSLYTRLNPLRISQVIGLISCLVVVFWFLFKVKRQKEIPVSSTITFVALSLYGAALLTCLWLNISIFSAVIVHFIILSAVAIALFIPLFRGKFKDLLYLLPLFCCLAGLILFFFLNSYPLSLPLATLLTSLTITLYPSICFYLRKQYS